MDTKKFFEEIRKIIKEEINLALNKRQKIDEETKFKSDIAKIAKFQESVKTPQKNGKTTLQELLDETKEALTEGKTVSFTSEDARGFDRASLARKLGYGDAVFADNSRLPQVDIDGRPITQVDSTVEKAVTRDYSELMKALNNKKKQ